MIADPAKLNFSSAFRYERIALKGSSSFNIAGGVFNTTITIVHNLGYVPYFKLFYSFSSGKTFALFAGPDSYDIDSNQVQIADVSANATSIVVTIDNYNVAAVSGSVYYRVYAEQQV